MIISRYIYREIAKNFFGIFLILFAILNSHILIRYLNALIAGKYAMSFLLQLIIYEFPNVLSILLPLGFYLSILLVWGRLYAEYEMIVILGSGYSIKKIMGLILFLATLIFLVESLLSFWFVPSSFCAREYLRENANYDVLFEAITPNMFYKFKDEQSVVYAEFIDKKHQNAKHVFLAQRRKNIDPDVNMQNVWEILVGENMQIQHDQKTKKRYVVINQGYRYKGFLGYNDFQVTQFQKYGVVIPDLIKQLSNSVKAKTTNYLLSNIKPNNPDRLANISELQWRLSLPISVLILAFSAVFIGRLKPKQGKYDKIFIGVLFYVVYINLLYWTQDLIMTNKISGFFGMWWIHCIAVFFILSVYKILPRLKQIIRQYKFK